MVPKRCPVCVVSPASSGCQCAPGPSASRRSSSCWSPPRTRPSTKCPSAKSPTQKPTGSTTWGWGGGPRRAGGKSRSEGSRNPLTAQELTAGAPPCAPPRAATLTDCRHPQLCSLGQTGGSFSDITQAQHSHKHHFCQQYAGWGFSTPHWRNHGLPLS